jgi:hypothetical protein
LKPREALFDVVAVDDIDENGYIIAKMTTIDKQTAKNLPDTFNVPQCSPGMERCQFDGAVLFRPCPTTHPNYRSAKQSSDEDLVLLQFLMFFDANLGFVPQSLINFVTREAMGVVWRRLLSVAGEVQRGARKEHNDAIARKSDFYMWVRKRVSVMFEEMNKKSKMNANCRQENGATKWKLQDVLRMSM